MSSKPRVMSELGSASGCVNRCLDILKQKRTRHFSVSELDEFMDRLEKADAAILYVAHEIDKLEDG